MIEKTAFLKSICDEQNPINYSKVVEYGNTYAGIIANNHAKKIIRNSVRFFHYETFVDHEASRRKKRFRKCVDRYGVTDFPKNMNDSICSKVLAGMANRSLDLIEVKRKKGNDVVDLRQSVLQFFKVLRIRSELKVAGIVHVATN